MRLTRLIVGAAIVVLAIWVLVGEHLAGASANAVINARLVTLRAPIAGEVVFPGRELGSAVDENEVLASVTDPLVDAVRLNDLEMELSFAETAYSGACAHPFRQHAPTCSGVSAHQ